MLEIEALIDAYGAACALEGVGSEAAGRARAALLTSMARQAATLLPWDVPVRVLAAILRDGRLDQYVGLRPIGDPAAFTVISLRWTALSGSRFWNLPSVEEALRALRATEVPAGLTAVWLDAEAERVWQDEQQLTPAEPEGRGGRSP